MQTSANNKISVRQFTILIILGTIGDSILILPTFIAHFAQQNSWISMIIASICGLAAGWMVSGIANQLQGRTIIEGARHKFGITVSWITGLLFLIQLFMCSLTLMNGMSQFLTTQLMPETPVNAILLLFMAVVIIAYRYGMEGFARMGELLFPVFLALFMCLVLFLIPQLNTTNLKPVLAEGFLPVFQGTLPAFAHSFSEMVLILMLTSYVSSKKSLTKPILTGYAVGGLVLIIVVVLCVLVLGPNLMESKYYPAFVLAQKITIGKFLERLEAILAFLWIITVFFKTTMIFYGLTTGIGQLLRLKENQMITIPLGILIIVCTVASSPNITVYNQLVIYYYPWFDVIFCFALPLLFYVVWMLVKKPTADKPKQVG